MLLIWERLRLQNVVPRHCVIFLDRELFSGDSVRTTEWPMYFREKSSGGRQGDRVKKSVTMG
jgi:hypothetical protein